MPFSVLTAMPIGLIWSRFLNYGFEKLFFIFYIYHMPISNSKKVLKSDLIFKPRWHFLLSILAKKKPLHFSYYFAQLHMVEILKSNFWKVCVFSSICQFWSLSTTQTLKIFWTQWWFGTTVRACPQRVALKLSIFDKWVSRLTVTDCYFVFRAWSNFKD